MTKDELYDFYVENCTADEISLSYAEWERKIYSDELEFHNKTICREKRRFKHNNQKGEIEMKISEIKQAEAGLKGFLCVGKVFYVGEVKQRTNKKNGETFTTQSLGISDGNNKETDSIFVEFSNIEELTDAVKGKTISCISCKINDWQGKRNLRASDFSFDVIPEDPAHPELPRTHVVEDKKPITTVMPEPESGSPSVYTLTPREQEEREYWTAKDAKKALFIARQHESSDAVALVCKFFKGSLEEAIAEVIKTSSILVDNVYQGQEKDTQEDKPEKTQEERVAEMAANTAKNVAALPINKEKTTGAPQFSTEDDGDLINE